MKHDAASRTSISSESAYRTCISSDEGVCTYWSSWSRANHYIPVLPAAEVESEIWTAGQSEEKRTAK